MGKGQRNHKQHHAERPQERPLKKARALDRATRILCAVALVLALVTGILPLASAFAVSYNLSTDAIEASVVEQITPVLPLGYACIPLLLFGLVIATVLLVQRKPFLALIGGGLATLGAVFLVLFAITCGQAFPFREVVTGGGIREIGLAFSDLIWRYYIALVPLAVMIAAFVCGLRARHHRELADMMSETAAPTITLGDAEE